MPSRILDELREHPLQRRLTLMTTLGVALAVILFSLVGYVALGVTLRHASEGLAATVAEALARPAADDITSSGGLTSRVAQVGDVLVEAVDADGAVLRPPGERRELVLEADDRAVAGSTGTQVTRRTGVSTTGEPYALAAVPLPGTTYTLVVGRTLGPVNAILGVQRLILLAVCLAGVVAAALIGGLVGRSGLRPVRRLTDVVEHVTQTQDFHPVSVRYATGDLARLASSFNLMLLSLAHVRDRQTRLVADAGHELRTPLTSLRTNVDLMRSDLPRGALTVEQRTSVLTDVDGQLAELGDMIGDFVHVLREETAVTLELLDFRDVVRSALERVGRRAQSRTFETELDPLFLIGNGDELVRVVTNLLDNAVKWSPAGGVVRVRLEGNRFRVSDSGPGIPEADLPYVFDRYFRGESGRHAKGTGLGLSIVARTVEGLGGSVEAGRSNDGGAELTLQLPGVTNRQAAAHLLIPAAG